jgi:hypothetical protein
MRDKPSVTLPGKVENVIKPVGGEPEKAQITIEEADPFIRNSLKDVGGEEVHLESDDEVDVTVETENASRPRTG